MNEIDRAITYLEELRHEHDSLANGVTKDNLQLRIQDQKQFIRALTDSMPAAETLKASAPTSPFSGPSVQPPKHSHLATAETWQCLACTFVAPLPKPHACSMCLTPCDLNSSKPSVIARVVSSAASDADECVICGDSFSVKAMFAVEW